MSNSYPLPNWAYALSEPTCHAAIRTTPEDFVVDEVLGFDPDGGGNHALLHIRKRNTNTDWLARQLAELAGVPLSEVGYAGLKDRHAVTSQYFSINLSGKNEPDWHTLESEEITLLDVDRHHRKLKRGNLLENRFRLILRELTGDCGDLVQRLETIRAQGVPNYFGTQRFGHAGGNLAKSRALFRGEFHERDRHLRGLYLSAARSYLFNQVLSARVTAGNWDSALPGESLLMDKTTSTFTVRILSNEIERKVADGELHPGGPLWGRGKPAVLADVLALETAILSEEGLLCEGLEKAGMEQERRSLRLPVKGLQWQYIDPEVLQLEFALPAGAYATSVLREVVQVHDASLMR
jgi:tRNA pseudouridine13 synthase